MDEEPGQAPRLPVQRLLQRDDVAAVSERDHLVRQPLRLAALDPEAVDPGVAEPIQRDGQLVRGHAPAEERQAGEDEAVALHGHGLRAGETPIARVAEGSFPGHLNPHSVRRFDLQDDRKRVGVRPGGRAEGEQHKAQPSKDAEPFHDFKNRQGT